MPLFTPAFLPYTIHAWNRIKIKSRNRCKLIK
nr:MAG TPA: hypothetical protein [Caudoviricetes sp.]